MERKEKRFYKIGETVWVKAKKSLGVIKELLIDPEANKYEAIVEIENSEVKVNLWEIDKNKRELFKEKRQSEFRKRPTVLFAKTKVGAIIPSKNVEDAGYDIYSNFEGQYIYFDPHETKLIPTGIASSVTDDYSLIVKERGSTGVKGMAVRAGVVDSSYRGEIFVAITNENKKPLVITKHPEMFDEQYVVYDANKAIAQLLLVHVPKANVKEISYDDLKKIPSVRGEGALGSSNK